MQETSQEINFEIKEELDRYILDVRELEYRSIKTTSEEIADFLYEVKGKHIRSILFYVLTKSIDLHFEPSKSLGCSFELLHTASLYHDDVIDHSNLRRGKQTLNQKYSSKFSILAGDLLLCTAINLVQENKSFKILSLFSELGQKLIQGILIEKALKIDDDYSDYYHQIYLKTASFFETICAIIAINLGLSEEQERLLKRFGIYFGKVFQIIDDYNDYFGRFETIGKEPGKDFFNHIVTLPLMILYDLDIANRRDIISYFDYPSRDNFTKILELMERSQVKKIMIDQLGKLAIEAMDLLEFVPVSIYKNFLKKMLAYDFNMCYNEIIERGCV